MKKEKKYPNPMLVVSRQVYLLLHPLPTPAPYIFKLTDPPFSWEILLHNRNHSILASSSPMYCVAGGMEVCCCLDPISHIGC